MIITRVYNNNIVEAKSVNGQAILQGKGIGFGKSKGDIITITPDIRVYELTDKKHYQYIKDILTEIPEQYWDFASRMNKYAQEQLKIKLDTNFYLSLLDHIYVAVKRANSGVIMKGVPTADIETYYKDIYEVSKTIVFEMNKEFQIEIDDSEIFFISTHLLDAILNVYSSESMGATIEVIKMILKIVDQHFVTIINHDGDKYIRFVSHVKRFAGRLVSNREEVYDSSISRIFSTIANEFSLQTACLNEITQKLKSNYDFDVIKDEQFYLLVHIIKITEKE